MDVCEYLERKGAETMISHPIVTTENIIIENKGEEIIDGYLEELFS